MILLKAIVFIITSKDITITCYFDLKPQASV